jgi:plastocyanin
MVKFKALLFLLFFFFIPIFSIAQTVHVVEVRNFEFVPMNVDIAVGDTVEWQWVEGTHTTTSDSTTGQNVWDEPIDIGHQVFRFVITAPGVHHYHCTPHQSIMVGTITATAVNSVDDETNSPEKFQLSQNYPNPFNPVTKIKYEIPLGFATSPFSKGGFVTLKVYDILGNEVATLVNEVKSAGEYEVEFNENNLPSGIYFYQLKAGGFTETRKMVLMK